MYQDNKTGNLHLIPIEVTFLLKEEYWETWKSAVHLSIFLYCVYQFLPNLVNDDVSAGKKLQSTDDDQ